MRRLQAARRPLGLVGGRVMLRPLSEAQRRHRRLALRPQVGGSRTVGLVVSAIGWVRWITVGVRRSVDAVLDRRGAEVVASTGLSLVEVRRELRRAGRRNGFPPGDLVALDLVHPLRREQRWGFVYTTEVGAFHADRDGPGDHSASRRLLADKAEFAERAAVVGVPVVPTLAVLAAGWSEDDLRDVLAEGVETMVKPVVGNRARGIRRVQRSGPDLDVVGLHGGGSTSPMALDAIRGDRAVVQPYVPSHSIFDGCGRATQESPTVRVITERDAGGGSVVTIGFAEVPYEGGYALVPVDVDRGVFVRPAIAPRSTEGAAIVEALLGRDLPGWSVMVEAALDSHGLVVDLYSVAWDFVPGPSGPKLLEGNSGWNVVPAQVAAGPFFS